MGLFTPQGAKRVAAVVRKQERDPSNRNRRRPPPTARTPSKFAVVTTANPGRPTASPPSGYSYTLGAGRARLQDIAITTSGGTRTAYLKASSTSVDFFHGGTDSIATGRLIQLKVIDGVYVVDVDYCSTTS